MKFIILAAALILAAPVHAAYTSQGGATDPDPNGITFVDDDLGASGIFMAEDPL
jgi:hypothetical protein